MAAEDFDSAAACSTQLDDLRQDIQRKERALRQAEDESAKLVWLPAGILCKLPV